LYLELTRNSRPNEKWLLLVADRFDTTISLHCCYCLRLGF